MQRIILTLVITASCRLVFAQTSTNTYPYPSSGNIGIGTTSPLTTLHLFGPGALTDLYPEQLIVGSNIAYNSSPVSSILFQTLYNSSGTTAGMGQIAVGKENSTDGNLASFMDLSVRVGAGIVTSALHINSNGNVGIGTTNPLSLLHVNGNIAAMASAGTDNYYLMFQRPSDGYIGARLGNAYSFAGYGGHLVFETNDGGGATSLVERMRITSEGNVGIGTTSPGEKLSVAGNLSLQLGPYYQNINIARVMTLGASGITGAQNWTVRGVYQYTDGVGLNAPGGDLDLIKSQDGNIVLATKTDGTALGNVLIGKTAQVNPIYILDVNGNVRANQITVNVSGADFVFEPSYHLTSLSTLSTYMSRNHHLPEIPSAKQMQLNGLDVGDNQMKLLQKVEELTLYLIEQHKQIKYQQRQIEALTVNMAALTNKAEKKHNQVKLISKKIN